MNSKLVNNYAFDAKSPSPELKWYNWAYGRDYILYRRHVPLTLSIALVLALALSLAAGTSFGDFLINAKGILHLISLVVISLSLGVCAVLFTRHVILNHFWSSSYVDGINDNAKSIKYTLEVIKHARSWLVLYDYGEPQQGNIYSSTEIQDALLAKLEESDNGFKLSLIFKKEQQEIDKLPLVQALKQWQAEHKDADVQVEIICGKDRADEKYRVYN